MGIILPCFAEPPENVLQGARDQAGVIALPFSPIALAQIVECDMIPIGQMPVNPIPSNQMVNTLELMGYLPRTIGPMVTNPDCGTRMLTIGQVPTTPLIDPLQQFVNSAISIDATGIMNTPAAPILSQPDQALNENTDIQVDYMQTMPPMTIPRADIANSGALKIFTCPSLPISMNRTLQLSDFVADDGRFIIKGRTLDFAANPLANCTVVVLIVSKLVVNNNNYANPVEATTTSDGSGNYSVDVHGTGPYQVMAYLPGSPDVAGVTLDTVVPVIG